MLGELVRRIDPVPICTLVSMDNEGKKMYKEMAIAPIAD